jgi:hypothetical protein
MSPLLNPVRNKIILKQTWSPMDPDAATYIAAVEQADQQALEEKVKIAIDNFILGCKTDGIWDSINVCNILAGARTLNGALVPLKGPTLTSFNFVSGDYNRKTGLKGNGSNKYLNTNYKISGFSSGQNLHLGLYGTESLNSGRPMGVFRNSVYSRHYLPVDMQPGPGGTSGWGSPTGITNRTSGHYISTRVTGGTATRYLNGSFNVTLNSDSSTPSDWSVTMFVANGSNTGSAVEPQILSTYSSARISFYHIGTGLTSNQVAFFSSRVATLLSAINLAI